MFGPPAVSGIQGDVSVRAIHAAMVGLCMCASTLAAAATQWHMPTPYAQSVHHTRNIVAFADEVRAATNGDLDITVHAGASLFKHPEIHRAVRGGQVAIGEMLMGQLGNDEPLFKVDNIPFLATDFDSAAKLWRVSRPALEAALDSQGLALLFAVPWPPQGLYARQQVTAPADFEGQKLRAYSPLTSRLAVLLGATPVTVQTPEIPQAFTTGVIDMMFTSPSTGVSSQAWDYTSDYLETRAWIPKNMVIVNKRAFRRLNEAQRIALLQAAARAEQRGWQMARAETLQDTRTLREKGMEVSEPGEALQERLRAAGRTLAREWADETGAQGRRILDAMRD